MFLLNILLIGEVGLIPQFFSRIAVFETSKIIILYIHGLFCILSMELNNLKIQRLKPNNNKKNIDVLLTVVIATI